MKDPSPQVFVTAVNLDSNREYVLPFNDVQERRWKHFYGVLPDLCCIIWRKLDAHNSIHGGDFKWPNVLRIVKVESRGRCRSFAGSTYCKGGRKQYWKLDQFHAKTKKKHDNGESTYLKAEHISKLDAAGMEWCEVEHEIRRFAAVFHEEWPFFCPNPPKTPVLGSWVTNQRRKYNNSDLSEDKIEKLKSVHFSFWVFLNV